MLVIFEKGGRPPHRLGPGRLRGLGLLVIFGQGGSCMVPFFLKKNPCCVRACACVLCLQDHVAAYQAKKKAGSSKAAATAAGADNSAGTGTAGAQGEAGAAGNAPITPKGPARRGAALLVSSAADAAAVEELVAELANAEEVSCSGCLARLLKRARMGLGGGGGASEVGKMPSR